MTGIIEGVILVIAALGLRDAIKLYIRKKEGCGSPKCKEFVMRTCTPLNASVIIDTGPRDGKGEGSTNSSLDNTICPELITDNPGT